MSKFGLLDYAAAFAPRLFQIRRSTWIASGVGFMVLLVLMLWAAVALIGGLWGQLRNLSDAAPDAERHEYLKDADRVGFFLAKDPKGEVMVTIVTVLP